MGFLSNLFGKKSTEVTPTKVNANTKVSTLADLEPFRRSCWLPILEDRDGDIAASKFAGIPYLASDEEWPNCPNCRSPIQLFVQLNSSELPAEAGKPWGEGLLQFFYCTNRDPMCDVDCSAWAPFGASTVVRVVSIGDATSRYVESPVPDAFPPRLIRGWTEKDDFPNWEEQQMLGVELGDSESDELSETYPRGGEKLLGWPCWIQGVEYPNCPECGALMQHVFQIDSDSALPFMFGDVGIGHITRCPQHISTLAFGWACS